MFSKIFPGDLVISVPKIFKYYKVKFKILKQISSFKIPFLHKNSSSLNLLLSSVSKVKLYYCKLTHFQILKFGYPPLRII